MTRHDGLSLFDEGPPPPCPARFNLARYAVAGAGAPGDKVALTVMRAAGDATPQVLTYGELRDAVLQAAGALSRQADPGARVILRVGHEIAFPIVFLGAAAAGLVAVPTSPMLSAGELGHIARDTGAALAVVSPSLGADGLACPILAPADLTGPPGQWADTGPDDLAYIIYTSGSSGRPKGVAHAHRAVWARRMMWAGWYGLTESDVMLHAGAFNWTYTLGAGLLDPWAIGASTLIYGGPRDPGVWPALAAARGATIFAAAPGVYRQLLASGAPLDGLSGLRHALSAGETMAATTRADWDARVARPIYEALGMTEVSTYLSSSPSAPPVPGRAGRPQTGRRIAILPQDAGETPLPTDEPGIIAVDRRDPGLMLGYWRAETETAAAMRGDWFLTGDMGRMNADGYVAFEGRADDMMNALGYRVAPEEVERALMEHGAVTGAAAVELPMRADLSLIAAFLTTDGPPPSEADLRAHCEARLANYKIPRIFEFVDALPRNPNGKLQRKKLVAAHRRDQSA